MIESLYLLLPLSVLFVLVIAAAFWWAIFSGQLDDVQAAGEYVLLDDDRTFPSDLSPHASADADARTDEKLFDGTDRYRATRTHGGRPS